ncbi:hypothetical protein J2S17_000558 [Cytobacillus purgationiresistens]|uniref:DNA (cytosine-5-)-methyltransferase n=1 Tax=Cytobacillus purgationiresistens TaxID=863449 RepID=A0ABU0ABQ3_9BACI|nr:hypothetical protein [Cytobacillus purgationiresistens]
MKSIELFAGIGGIALAAEWAGIETVAFCEREPFCQRVLNKHWPSVPIFDDVCTLNKQTLEERGIDVGAIDIISGGYPCQPFSSPGNRKGEEDDRHLWPEVKRLLQEIRPNWFVGENVAGHITLGLDTVLYDLESIGYTWQSLLYRLHLSEPITKDTGYLLLPTPTASQNYKPIRKLAPSERNGSHGKTLPGGIGEKYPEHIGYHINPQYVEWMMGFPSDWTKVE